MKHEFGLPGVAFGPGPWEEEPGRVEWRHKGTPCLLRRNGFGAWCGYAAVPPGHPLHGKDYDTPEVDVHGGLTYASDCDVAGRVGICHVPEPGEPGDVWWFGFDCAHAFDLAPSLVRHEDSRLWKDSTYRTLDYAKAETERLAEQLQAVAS